MKLDQLNDLAPTAAIRLFLECCGSQEWATRMVLNRPFKSAEQVLDEADRHWLALGEPDWLEAFAAHPRIGEQSASAWSQREQASVLSAADETKQVLAKANREYERRFGFIFIVFAAGKTPAEILTVLRERLHNDRDTEIRKAVAEQMKITRDRLERMGLGDWGTGGTAGAGQ